MQIMYCECIVSSDGAYVQSDDYDHNRELLTIP